jgi:hypothetical protein
MQNFSLNPILPISFLFFYSKFNMAFRYKPMKGVEDFVWVLIAAIVILLALSLLSGTYIAPVPANVSYITTFSNLGSVGFLAELPAHIYSLDGLSIGIDQKENLKFFDNLQIESSWFGTQKADLVIAIPNWAKSWQKGVKISFDVSQTNKYGRLFIRWNGAEVFGQIANPRAYEIVIPKENIFDENKLEIGADGPGLMFWATTVYQLKAISIDLIYGPAKIVPFELTGPELEAFSKGSLSFYGWGDGNLSIKINGVEIYNKMPSGPDGVNFSMLNVPINLGQNIVSLYVPNGSVRLENTKLELWILTEKIEREKTFNITESQWTALAGGKGRIEFDVADIMRGGSIKIELNGNALAVPEVKKGINIVQFSSSQANKGLNKIKFSATGAFDIGDVRIGIER